MAEEREIFLEERLRMRQTEEEEGSSEWEDWDEKEESEDGDES